MSGGARSQSSRHTIRLQSHWSLDPAITFLNHGSYGACPLKVLDRQAELRVRIERQPVAFFGRDLEVLWDEARAVIAGFLGAQPDDLAFVPNATTGVNAVVRSLRLQPGDELVTTDHAYNACSNALAYAAEVCGARLSVARVPFPLSGPDEVVDAVLGAVTARTRLVMIDHVTSPTALIFPVKALVAELAARGIDTLVDGAHAPGMVPLEVAELGAAYYTGNFHKWVCAPKGAGFLHVRRDRQEGLHPVVISHGYNVRRSDRSQFRAEFDWTGTSDPTAALSVPAAIAFLSALFPGGLAEVAARNHALALAGRRLLADALGVALPAPDEMVGSMAALPLPDDRDPVRVPYVSALQAWLYDEHRIEVPIFPWPAPPRRLLRISAQVYNTLDEYARLAEVLANEAI
jgi:isopenicillin-N epimerase